MTWRDVYYSFPQAGYLILLAIPLLFLLWLLFNYRQRVLSLYNSSQLIIPRSKELFWFKAFAWILVWILGSIALMGPKGNLQYHTSDSDVQTREPSPLRRKAHEILFLVDTSASMTVPDGRLKRTRLDQAKEIMEEIVSQLTGETVSLYPFTSELTPLVPPTLDYLFTRLMIRQLNINEGDVGGTNIIKALQTVSQKITSSNKLYTIILLSDGGDNQFERLQEQERHQAAIQLSQQLSDLNNFNLRIFTIGMGSPKGQPIPNVTFNGQPVTSKLDEQLLKELANQYRGNYYTANEWTTIDLARQLINKMGQDSPYEDRQTSERRFSPVQEEDIYYDLYFQIPLGIAILLLILALTLPDTGNFYKSFIVFFLLHTIGLGAQNSVEESGKQAQALFAARAYHQSAEIYNRLLRQDLENWQQALVLYNLGTIHLAQKQPIEALTLFKTIPSQSIFSPWLLRNLHINQGLAYLQQANNSAIIDDEDRRLYLLHQSYFYLREALQVDCRLQRWEEDRLQACLAPPDLSPLLTQIYQDINRIRQRQRQDILKQNNPSAIISWLMEGLERLQKDIQKSGSSNLYQDYLLANGNKLKALWANLQQQPWDEEQQTQINKAFSDYEQALNHIETAYEEIANIIVLLRSLADELAHSNRLNDLLAHYRLLLTYDILPLGVLESLQNKQKALTVETEANRYLQKSIDQLKQGDNLLAQLFLHQSYYSLQDLQLETPKDPVELLKQGIERAKQAAHLNRIAQLRPLKQQTQKEVQQLLTAAQSKVVPLGPPFAKAVLELQTRQFRQSRSETSHSRCQKNPWKQAIPLFEYGYQEAIVAQNELKTPVHWPDVLGSQEETIVNWERVLKLIEQPPQETPEEEQQSSDQSSAPANLDEVFQLLQEMESQDRPEPSPPQQELHAW